MSSFEFYRRWCIPNFLPKNFQILDNDSQKGILEDVYQQFELKLDHASFEKIIKDKYFILAITFVTTLSIALLYLKVSKTIMQQIASLSIVSLLVLVMYRTHLKSKFLSFCGNISYEIYLCHYLIMLPLNNTYKFVNPGYKSSIYSVQLDNQFLVAVLSVFGTICISSNKI